MTVWVWVYVWALCYHEKAGWVAVLCCALPSASLGPREPLFVGTVASREVVALESAVWTANRRRVP